MIFRIEHKTTYKYSEEVELGPHMLRITPRSGPGQRVLSHEIAIDPVPHGQARILDAEGNSILSVWFTGKTSRLVITNKCEVETLQSNPFDYLVLSANRMTPPALSDVESEALAPYLVRADPTEAVDAFAQSILRPSEGKTLPFLTLLNHVLYKEFETVLRPEGASYSPSVCLGLRQGACRDLTVLFMDVCRSVGIPARFVSGYQEGDVDMTHRHLHAWPEVYMPGAGWRGYDPTTNLAVADKHIPTAASHTPLGAAPIEGAFSGAHVESVMEHELRLSG
jgi:transglutaminase-like putative cysteine protease